MVQVKPNTSEPEPQSISITEDIDEELDDFLNSSISASEDFTKEETVTEEASLKADYMEKLWCFLNSFIENEGDLMNMWNSKQWRCELECSKNKVELLGQSQQSTLTLR